MNMAHPAYQILLIFFFKGKGQLLKHFPHNKYYLDSHIHVCTRKTSSTTWSWQGPDKPREASQGYKEHN